MTNPALEAPESTAPAAAPEVFDGEQPPTAVPPAPTIPEAATEPTAETADTAAPESAAEAADMVSAWLEAETAWKTQFDADWEHQRIEFHGDYLAVRTPKQAALTAVTLAGSKNGADDGGLGMINLFLNLYVGPESRERIDSRMLDPEEQNYGDYPLQHLFQTLGKLVAE